MSTKNNLALFLFCLTCVGWYLTVTLKMMVQWSQMLSSVLRKTGCSPLKGARKHPIMWSLSPMWRVCTCATWGKLETNNSGVILIYLTLTYCLMLTLDEIKVEFTIYCYPEKLIVILWYSSYMFIFALVWVVILRLWSYSICDDCV